MHVKLYRTPRKTWWFAPTDGSSEVSAELQSDWLIAFDPRRRCVLVQREGHAALTVDEAIKRGIIRIVDDAPAP